MGNVWFLDPSQAISMMTMSIFTIVVGVGAILSWFSYLPAVIAIVLPAAGTLAVLLLLHGDKTSMALGIMFFLMSLTGIVGSIKLARMLNHALRLNFENAALRQESEEKSLLLETALENMGQGISMSDSDDRLRMWNRQFIQLLGEAGAKVATNAKLSSLLSSADPPLQVLTESATEYRLRNGQVYEIRQSQLAQGGRV
jgi:PAS domain-containing protein